MWKMLMLKNNKNKKTTWEENLILFPYHKHGTPISVPLVCKTHCDSSYKTFRKNTDLYCFEYIIEGTQYVVADKKYKVSAGDFCIIHGYGQHLYYADKNNPPTKVSICAYGKFIKQLLDAYNITQVVFPHTNILHIFEKLFLLKDKNNYDYFCQQTAMAIHELIHCILPNKQRSENFPNYIIEAKNFLDASLQVSLNLDALCKKVGISKPQLIKNFKKYYNTTPYNYLLNLKIETSKWLLTNTDNSIKEIAYHFNFSDEYYFSNLFKKKVGVSPKTYKTNKSNIRES